jgi:hypothetical protein
MNETERRQQVTEVKRKIAEQKKEFLNRVRATIKEVGLKKFREVCMINLNSPTPNLDDMVDSALQDKLSYLETHPIRFVELSKQFPKKLDIKKLKKRDLETLSQSLQLALSYQHLVGETERVQAKREEALIAFKEEKELTKDNSKASKAACKVLGFVPINTKKGKQAVYTSDRIINIRYFYLDRLFRGYTSKRAIEEMMEGYEKRKNKRKKEIKNDTDSEIFPTSHRALAELLAKAGCKKVARFSYSKKKLS